MSITYSTVEGKEIARIIGLIENVVDGEKRNAIMMACIAMAISLQAPNITPERMIQGVKEGSEWIACYVSTPQGMVN